ncbi:hypothetical protein [Thioalkalivibrio sp. ALE16]|uniref:hypothetical protein n=1 Tax=Thioalkalivibrio sp. ALE16 TaxID=1158172 RepID=UPI00037D5464|nr:hypothetical protein [Thioalkalivibrio sp. ALE16]
MGTINEYLNDLQREAAENGFCPEQRVNEKTPWELLQELGTAERIAEERPPGEN